MKQPQKPSILPDFSGHTQVMFVTEGNPTAYVLTNKGGNHDLGGMKMPSAEAGLAWCRKHAAMLVYTPLNVAKN